MVQLISKSSINKLRILEFDYHLQEDGLYVIERWSYQYNGKRTKQPDLIANPKSNRNPFEQVKLMFNHLIKHAQDKGYKILENPLESYTESELQEVIGDHITGISGIPKPMLAKPYDKITNSSIFDKQYFASPKIDGLRILIYMDDNGELHTSSRGGSNYDNAMRDILSHPTLIKVFKENPRLIMDGEGYHHGYSLAYINSMARKQVSETDYSFMQFYWYDIVRPDLTFESRLAYMNQIVQKFNITYSPERIFEPDELRIQIVPQIYISGLDAMKHLHDDFVNNGWEGLVVRYKDSFYKPGGRSNDMIKFKMFTDDEFEVYDYQLGLRGTEDMIFKCLTHDGKEFSAKPIGNRELKEHYVKCFDELYKNKLATIKYFYYSEDGIPQLPVLKCFRLKEDIDG